MCRSIEKAGNRKNVRCVSCENPDKRRARQNLSYHLNKAKQAVDAESGSVAVLDRDTKESGIVDNAPISQKVIDNRVELITKYRNEVQSLTLEEWTKPHGEYKTTAEVLALREKEISSLGAVVSARAQQIAGITYDEAREKLQTLERESDKIYEEIKRLKQERNKVDKDYPDVPRPAEYHEKYDALVDESFRATDKFNENGKELLAEEKRLSTLFAESHRKALSEVRPLGGTVKVIGSTKFIGSSFQNAIDKNIPSDWISRSNELEKPLQVESSKSRGNYSSSKVFVEYYEEAYGSHPEPGYTFRTEDGKPHPEDCRYLGWTQDEDEMWSGQPVEIADHTTPMKTLANGTLAPRGRGWKKGKIYEVAGFNQEDMELQEVYYKPMTWTRRRKEAYPAIQVGVEAKNGKIANPAEFESTSVHEFVHHMEKNNEKLVSVQNTFYQRRTTNPDGTKMKLVTYGTHDDEFVREDSFVSTYMGKDYGDKAPHKEVLTTGSEALLTGRYGGLTGVSRTYTKKDTDMLNFVLGSLSTL